MDKALERIRDSALLNELEPFSVGFLCADRDDEEYRVASGLYNLAKHIKLTIPEGSVFAGAEIWFNDHPGVKFGYGDGTRLAPENFDREIAAHPEGAELLKEVRSLMEPHIPLSAYDARCSERQHRMGSFPVGWGGGWGGHSNPDYAMVLRLGTSGLRRKVELFRGINEGKDDFYDALILTLDAIEIRAGRYCDLAASLASEAAAAGKTESAAKYQRISDAFSNIPMNPPRDLFEAIQCFWFVFGLDGIDSPGRLDQFLGDYYEKAGEDSDRFELMCALWELFHATRTWNLCIGGSDEFGVDQSNTLTYDILRIARKFRYNTPNLTLRVHPGTPDAIWQSAAETIATGIGMPAIYNDDVVCPALESLGIPPSDSHLYCMNGCNQIDIFGKSHMGLEDGELCLADCVKLALLDGYYIDGKDERLGAESGDPRTFTEFSQFMAAYKKQVEQIVDLVVDMSDISQRAYAEFGGNPYRCLTTQGCVEKGKDFKAGGPIYGHGQILLEGVADAVDSLAAIRHFVFETHKYTMADFIDAVQNDFVGHEDLLRDVTTMPKFGNDIPEIDCIYGEIYDHVGRYVRTKQTFRGGIYTTGCSTFNRTGWYAGGTGALPNGKLKDSVILADSIGATPGNDRKGPTALLKSVSHSNQRLCCSGNVMQLKFTKDLFDTDTGKAGFISLAKSYFRLGGQQLSINVLSTEELIEAQKDPEHHRDLIVRVGGYSDYFVTLSKALQDNIIARTDIEI